MHERERLQPRAEIGDGRHRARLAAPVDERGSRAVERKRTVIGDREVERRLARRQRDFVSEDVLAAGDDIAAMRIGARDPAAQATPRIPIGPHGLPIVEAEPAGAARRFAIRIKRDDFQIRHVAELQQVIVGAHVVVALTERDIETEARANVRDTLGEGWGDDGEMVELEREQRIARRSDQILLGDQCAEPVVVGNERRR